MADTQPQAEKLAACPFCGAEPKLTERPESGLYHRFVCFIACYCGGYSSTAHQMGGGQTQDEARTNATTAWNTRALLRSQQPGQDEPFGHFKAEPFGWTDCAPTDEGAVALYERPQPAPGEVVDWVSADTSLPPIDVRESCSDLVLVLIAKDITPFTSYDTPEPERSKVLVEHRVGVGRVRSATRYGKPVPSEPWTFEWVNGTYFKYPYCAVVAWAHLPAGPGVLKCDTRQALTDFYRCGLATPPTGATE